jgi:hypothetical protein
MGRGEEGKRGRGEKREEGRRGRGRSWKKREEGKRGKEDLAAV